MRRSVLALLLLALTAGPGSLFATTFIVHPDGTGDYPTIQAAIGAAAAGDTIALADGLFIGDGNRDLEYLGKDLLLRSQSGDAEACILDCQGFPEDPHRGFLFISTETPNAVVECVTVTGADLTGSLENGGAVYCGAGSAPTIRRCRFEGNHALDGAAIYCGGNSAPMITDCSFVSNSTGGLPGGGFGAGICCRDEASPRVVRSVFSRNSSYWAGAIHTDGSASATIDSCLFSDNGSMLIGGAMILRGGFTSVRGCTFVGNSTETGTVAISCESAAGLLMENTIVAFSENAASVFCAYPETVHLACCDLFGNSGGDWIGGIAGLYGIDGNLSEDPLFCDRENGDYRVRSDSPCAEENSGDCGQIGARGIGCSANGVADSQPRPTRFRLESIWPNPCDRSLSLRLFLPVAVEIRIELFDPAGRRVARFDGQRLPSGWSEATYPLADLSPTPLAPGVYLFRLKAGEEARSGRVLVLE